MGSIREPERDVPVVGEVDVLVVGGGPAGVCASVAAARAGARTALVERHGFLGGMWTAGLVITLGGYNSWLRPYPRCVEGVAGDWLRAAASRGGAENSSGWVLNSDPEAMKRAADELVEGAGVRLLLHTWVARPLTEAGRTLGVFVENVDGRGAILATVTVDCTGNGDVMARAGARWASSPALQPMTVPFFIGPVGAGAGSDPGGPVHIPIGPEPGLLEEPDLSRFASRRQGIACDRKAMGEAHARGEIPAYGGPWFGGMDPDRAWVNTTRISGDATDAAALTAAEVRGREEARALAGYFRGRVPELASSRLLQTGAQVGIRETRRLVGAQELTGDDIRRGVHTSGGVAVGCWPVDVHPASGTAGVHALYVPRPYGIPYGCLVPAETDGLLVAGRCLSADREGLGSARVGATCAAMGQAAGVAAAIAAGEGTEPRGVDVETLRKALRDQGAIVDPPG